MTYIYDGVFHEGTFISRPNRFLAEIGLGGEVVLAHVKNTGRMGELLLPGNKAYIREAQNPDRKTKYDLISIEAQGRIINLDSQIPNKVIEEGFRSSLIEGYENPEVIKREVSYGRSRLDMKVSLPGRDLFVEVKGVDLVEDGVAMFPDAPTERGTRHLLELEEIVLDGGEAMVIFLIQRDDAELFRPHFQRDPVFGQTLREVAGSGVQVRAYGCQVGYKSIKIQDRIQVSLE